MAEKTKEKRIKAEYRRLSKLFAALPPSERAVVEPLIQNSAFMRVTLEDLAASISENGATDEYQNGANQSGTKASAELNAYNSTMKSYLNVQKQLVALLPKDEAGSTLAAQMAEALKDLA